MTTTKQVLAPGDLGSGHAIDLLNQKAIVPSADVWRKQSDNTQAGADSDNIQHAGNVAVKQNLAARTKTLATVAQLDATNTSNIRLTSAGVIEGITGGEDGKLLVLTNVSAGEITLTNGSTSATAETAIKIGDSFNFVMAPNASVTLNYDPVDQCWRSVSQTVLGFAPEYFEAINNVAQTGVVTNTNVVFQSQQGTSGNSITAPTTSSFLLKAGRKYKLTGVIGQATIPTNGFAAFRWHNGTAYFGGMGQLVQVATRPGTCVCEAFIAPLVDTTVQLRCLSASGSTGIDANAAYARIEVVEGLAPASNIKLLSRVHFGSQLDPNVVSPAGDAIEGETFFQTVDGTKTGSKLAVWKYDGTTWHRMTQFSLVGTSSTADGIRTYYPSVVALQSKWTVAFNAASIAANGFTAVGGATVADYGSAYGSPAQRMLALDATRPTVTTSANTLRSLPTSYIRHEIAVKPTTANHYMLQLLTGGGWREVTAEVWLCNPTTDAPEKRLYGQAATNPGDTNGAGCGSLCKAPDNATAYEDWYRQWVGWELPLSVITAYKTASDTIKLAIRPSGDNASNTSIFVCGYAMLESAHSMIHMPMMAYENTVNIPGNRVAASGGNQPVWWVVSAGYGAVYIPPDQNRIFDIPLPDTSKDIYLNALGLWRDGTDTDGYGEPQTWFTIIHASGDVALGRPRPDIVAPIARQQRWGWKPMGFVIPAAVLQAKATQLNAIDAIPYLRVRINAPNRGINAHFAALITEQV
ncbi:hypothetical protein [Thiothrix winogradskyi]|uniref:Uncharacterized protein n=1 Tax=Thiothrix winogradskyi TaxID=96472 RepID=A0ABY3T4B1_9GAMM|nr:hypothetical protein [Thiothrix winogradskyi]UJS26268.1 hypothetical protein L2Y54_09575 [Thiothrix winogradskyi]